MWLEGSRLCIFITTKESEVKALQIGERFAIGQGALCPHLASDLVLDISSGFDFRHACLCKHTEPRVHKTGQWWAVIG